MDNNTESFMTPRLYAIANLAQCNGTVLDIGTDHAYIPVYLVYHGKAKTAIAADVSYGPLCRASENIKRFGMESKIKTVLSDGFSNIEDNFDTAVIAGMGGLLICDILKGAPRGKKYILQPMRALPELKKFLFDNGYIISDEVLALENNKLYNILAVCDGHANYSELDLYIGKKLADDALYPMYRERLKKKFGKIICGIKSAKIPDTSQIEYYKNLLFQLEDNHGY